jgi:HSP20 family protein
MSNLQKYQGSLMRPFRDFFADDFFGNNWLERNGNLPAVNIAEKDNEYDIELAAPGYKKDDFKIKVDEDVLTISAEAKKETKEEKKDYTRQEYSYSSFSRSFHLPDNVKDDAIEAKYENGMLRLSIPKSKTQMKATKEVAVS